MKGREKLILSGNSKILDEDHEVECIKWYCSMCEFEVGRVFYYCAIMNLFFCQDCEARMDSYPHVLMKATENSFKLLNFSC